jgi:DNA-binding transcriptional MerR regulator
MFSTATDSMTLEALAGEAQRVLEKHGLSGAQPDARVSAAPDARTVRYYTTLGLLDRPGYEGREARYQRRHLVQLVAIKALQAQGLSLGEIQTRLYGRSEKELAAFAEALARELRQEQIELPRSAFRTVHEIQLAPGLKLQAEEGFEATEAAVRSIEEKVRAALAALARARRGAGGK